MRFMMLVIPKGYESAEPIAFVKTRNTCAPTGHRGRPA